MRKFDDIATAVMAVIINEEKKVLAVSRKDDHSDFGLPGGKVEKIDVQGEYSVIPERNAMIREVKEETGLDVDELGITVVYAKCGVNRMKYTFYAEVKDMTKEFNTMEPHVVKWVHPYEVLRGSFGDWNWEVFKSLQNMGLDLFKK